LKFLQTFLIGRGKSDFPEVEKIASPEILNKIFKLNEYLSIREKVSLGENRGDSWGRKISIRSILLASHKARMIGDDARSNLVSVDCTRAIARHLPVAAAGLGISRIRCRNTRGAPNVEIGSAVPTAKRSPV